MNSKVKQVISIILTVGAVGAVLSSCGEKPPTDEITTGTEIHQLVDKYGVMNTTAEASESAKSETKKAKEEKTEKDKSKKDNTKEEKTKAEDGSGEKTVKDEKADGKEKADLAETTKAPATTAPLKVSDVEFVLQNYYTDGVNYGEIQNIAFDEDSFASTAYGFLDVKMTYVGSRDKNMVISYRAYDESGKLCRNAKIVVKLDGVKSGDTVEHIRFNVPFNAVKVEFFDDTKEVQ